MIRSRKGASVNKDVPANTANAKFGWDKYPFHLCEPPDIRQSPRNAILYRKVGIENFTEKAIRDTKTLEMAGKVFGKLTSAFSNIQGAEPAIVEIKTKRGKVYSKRVDYAPGSPGDPMSFDDVARKFIDCCNYSAKPIPGENQDKVIRMVARLEDVADVCQIPSLLG